MGLLEPSCGPGSQVNYLSDTLVYASAEEIQPKRKTGHTDYNYNGPMHITDLLYLK